MKKYIKLPDILIFTLERYQGPTNNVSIIPDELLDVRDYTDKSVIAEDYIYELFAIKIRFGSTANFGHEICQVNRNGKRYEINDIRGYQISNILIYLILIVLMDYFTKNRLPYQKI